MNKYTMNKQRELLQRIKGGLIVSCQALKDEPLYGAHIMARMALAAKQGGAVAIRANGREDIQAIKEKTGLPVIGIVKREYPGSEVYITPTMAEVEEVVAAGADIIAFDATNRKRPDGTYPEEFIQKIREKFPEHLLMADVSTASEGIAAANFGADLVSTTMAGYTPYTVLQPGPDFALIEQLVAVVSVPVIAEGRIRNPNEAVRCLEKGAWAVVVGSAISRPQLITRLFVDKIRDFFEQSS